MKITEKQIPIEPLHNLHRDLVYFSHIRLLL